MSKYTTISNQDNDNDLELNAYRHGHDHPTSSYRDDPPVDTSNSFDSEEYDNDDNEYDEDYNDEEIAVQSNELRAASTASASSSRCRVVKCIVLMAMIAAWIGGGKYYIDKNGVPDSVNGFLTQFKADLEEWRGGNGGESAGEEEISAFVNEEVGEESRTPLDSSLGDDQANELEQDVTQDSAQVQLPEEEEPIINENTEEPIVEPVSQEQNNEPIVDEEEPLSEQEGPIVEPVSEEQEEAENVGDQETEENNVVDDLQEQGNLDYMVGATGTTSREWNAVEMVAHDSTSFT
jgi:hypothetical protein